MTPSLPPSPNIPTPLRRVAQAMNFQCLREAAPPVFVTMDHRAVLVAGWAAHRQGLFDPAAPPLLVRLDAHLDMGERPRPWAMERRQLTDLDAVHALANDQRHDDGGWVITAMQWGLVSDVATFFVHDYHRFPGDDAAYPDHTTAEHRLWTYGSLSDWQAARARGARKAATLASELGLDGEAPAAPRRPLWVDIDLDFATRRAGDDSVSEWTAADWEAELGPASPGGDALGHALRHATLVTLSLEPWFCGGMGAAGRLSEGLSAATARWGDWFSGL